MTTFSCNIEAIGPAQHPICKRRLSSYDFYIDSLRFQEDVSLNVCDVTLSIVLPLICQLSAGDEYAGDHPAQALLIRGLSLQSEVGDDSLWAGTERRTETRLRRSCPAR